MRAKWGILESRDSTTKFPHVIKYWRGLYCFQIIRDILSSISSKQKIYTQKIASKDTYSKCLVVVSKCLVVISKCLVVVSKCLVAVRKCLVVVSKWLVVVSTCLVVIIKCLVVVSVC